MKINSFRAENVHGYLNFNIEFFPELTFLIGINGSGKTSALKLILGLTSPSYHYLNQIDYDYCEVICSSNETEKDIVIRSVQDKEKDTFFISLTLSGELFVIEDDTPIKRTKRANEERIYDQEEFSLIEQRQKEAFDNSPVTRKIREIATPKFLGLDRRIYEGKSIDARYKTNRQLLHPKYRRKPVSSPAEFQAIDISLEEVQYLVYDYFRKIAQQQPQISDEFKQKIFRQSFSFQEISTLEDIPTVQDTQERKASVLKAIEDLELSYLNSSVNEFFTKMEVIAQQNAQIAREGDNNYKSEDYVKLLSNWFNNGAQLRRINDLIRYSQEYQAKIAELREPIKRLEEITSDFLWEGKKELEIAPDGEIRVKIKNQTKSNIYELSSGEKQIIIMIAHLIFEEAQRPSGIFIIDEPELSLHIAWQEIFVYSITKASPKTQFILATHSPSIISEVKNEKFTQDLNKLNA